MNKRLNGKVKPLVRFVKAWKFYNNVPVLSFYLELRVAKYAQGESVIVYGIDVERVFRQLEDIDLARIQDPMGISGYISACPSQAAREEAKSKTATAGRRARYAWEAKEAARIREAFD